MTSFMSRAALGLALCLTTALPALAETTLRAVSGFDLSAQFGQPFEAFVEEFNEKGKGILQIQIIGGPDAMPPTETGNAVKNGVVDMAWTAANWYENLFPEASAIMLSKRSPAELRENGGWDLLNEIHQKKVNAVILTTFGYGQNYHQYLVKPVESLTLETLKGMRVRPTPGMPSFSTAMGMTNVSIVPGEMYTALERNLLDGYNWPAWGLGDLGWDRLTAHRMEPGFGNVQNNMILNKATFEKLTEEEKAFLAQMITWFDGYAEELIKTRTAEEYAKQEAAGVKPIRLSEEETKVYQDTFYGTQWDAFEQKSPEYGAKIRALFAQ